MDVVGLDTLFVEHVQKDTKRKNDHYNALYGSHNAIVAGGTGLYMDSLIRGNDFAPFPSTGMREKLEAQADREGMEAMLELLRSIDPESAGTVFHQVLESVWQR